MTNSEKFKIDDINDYIKIIEKVTTRATEVSKDTQKATVLALHGDLGAGKTTFTKELAKYLGITETVTSPTYVIKKTFNIPAETRNKFEPFKNLIHIDTYRIDLQDELTRLGWGDDVADDDNLVVVEWPENIPDILPESTVHIYFTFVDEVTREVEIK